MAEEMKPGMLTTYELRDAGRRWIRHYRKTSWTLKTALRSKSDLAP